MNESSKRELELQGRSFIAGERGKRSKRTFRGHDPRTGLKVAPDYHAADREEVETAVQRASAAFEIFGSTAPEVRARLLATITEKLEERRTEIVARASLETGLPLARFEGELGRTCGQLSMFADMVREGSWVDARIDRGQPERLPVPKPDVRSMLRPVGPVVVFCASNFPLAFSAAGGDTASALAAACPVIVVGHMSHPGTAELAGAAISEAVAECGLPPGVFSLVYQDDFEAGNQLVKHPHIMAVGFTGSRSGGRAIMDHAAARKNPIPVFAEMSSVNPLFILDGALSERAEEIANGLFESFTLGYGQFCTKPGLVFVTDRPETEKFVDVLAARTAETACTPLLNKSISESFEQRSVNRSSYMVAKGVESDEGFAVPTTLQAVSLEQYLKDPSLADEQFGPSTLVIRVPDTMGFIDVAQVLEGELTATIHGNEEDLKRAKDLISLIEAKAGRLIINGFPTGVEVCPAMVHGGPYPATSDSRSTSVGTRAVERFCRLVAYQDFPDELLPPELQESNPTSISRSEID